MGYKLEFPGASHKEAWEQIITEFSSCKEKPAPYGIYLKLGLDAYDEFLRLTNNYHNGEGLLEGHVPMSTYFFMEDGKPDIYGAISIRHRLNEYLLNVDGNIGYAIRPSARNQGLAAIQLGLALNKCLLLGMDKVLITCNDDNYKSAAVIRKLGGILENTFLEDNGNTVERYWIDLTTMN